MDTEQLYDFVRLAIDESSDIEATLKDLEDQGFRIVECCLWGEDSDVTVRDPRTNAQVKVGL